MVGIAIINYRTFEKTIECINSIKTNTSIPYKIYLLDNASPNDSAEQLAAQYKDDPLVELILEKENMGYAKGNNVCIQHMISDGCDYGIVSNNDILCRNRTIDILIDDLAHNAQLLLVGPKIFSPKNEFQPSVHLTDIYGVGYLLRTSYVGSFTKSKEQENRAELERITVQTEVLWVSGAFFAFSVSNMKRIGCFDSNTFLFYEEAILAQKVKECGLKMAYDPNAVVTHDHGYSTGGGKNIIARIAAVQSEFYYFREYRKVSSHFLRILKAIRNLETIYSFGKRGDIGAIKTYFNAMKTER